MEINNLTKEEVDKKLLEGIAEEVLRKENKSGDLSVALIEDEEIRGINNKYRGINNSTDVLSFEGSGDFLGEILICPNEVRKNGKIFKKELIRVLIHGILHLLQYDHEKDDGKMLKKQEEYLAEIWQKHKL